MISVIRYIAVWITLAAVSQSVAANDAVAVLELNCRIAGTTMPLTNQFMCADASQYVVLHRLVFYLSQFELRSANGELTPISNVHVLADLLKSNRYVLNTTSANNVQSIRFGIGVDPLHNHEDPSTYPNGHPLAHQTPSMHWGWIAGYRFIVVEGNASRSQKGPESEFQIHTVDDALYRIIEVDVETERTEDTLYIRVNADIDRFCESIPLWNGVVNHGSENEAVTLTSNMATKVFTPTTFTSVPDESFRGSVFPNPTSGIVTIVGDQKTNNTMVNIRIVNHLGQIVYQNSRVTIPTTLSINHVPPGIYTIMLSCMQSTQQCKLVVVQ